MDLGVAGLASNFDWRSFVEQLSEVERAPQRRWASEQSQLQQRTNAYGSIKTQLGVLRNRVEALKDPALFQSRATTVGDSTVLKASGTEKTPLGSYTFSISQLATTARYQGAGNIGKPLSATDDVSGVLLEEAGFSSAVTEGTFTVNGKQVTVAGGDTLQQVFDKISTATSGSVTASYDPAADQIRLNSAGEIVLGTPKDTSNFLQVSKLFNNGTGTIQSSSGLGGIHAGVALTSGNFAAAVSDGGSGAGEFKINGVSVQFDASKDSLTDVLSRINESEAGVTASYDSSTDRLVLTNKTTGDTGVALEDVTGNFLEATGLNAGTLTRGKNLQYRVNDGDLLTSSSNVITEASSGIPGLTVTALKEGTTTVQNESDTSKIRKAITDFVAEYNKVQSLIANQTASSTDPKGKVTAGILSGEREAGEISARLRGLSYHETSGLPAALNHLSDLGIETGGYDDQLTLSDATKLDDALADHLSQVQSLFTDETNGIAAKLDRYLEATIGEDGSLVTKQENISKQIADLDTQISTQERLVLGHEQALIASSVAMEKAQANINQQMQFLTQRFGAG